MTKKALLLTAASFVASTALSNPSPCGFYAGAGVGIASTEINFDLDVRNGTDFGKKSFHKKRGHSTLSTHAGYQTPLWERAFIGAEIFVRPQDYVQKTLGINVVEEVGPTTLYQDVRLRVERSLTLGAAVQWGGYINDDTAAYVSVAISGANMKVSYGEAGANTGSDKKFLFGIAPGGGFVHHMSEKDIMRVGYSYETQTAWTTKDLDPDDTNQFKVKLRNRSHNFAVSYSRFF